MILYLLIIVKEYSIYEYAIYNVFIQSPAGRYLDYLQGLAITNKVAINTLAQVFLWTYVSFLLGKPLGVELLEDRTGAFLSW